MINFPNNPSVDDQYEFQGRVWRWTGAVWSIVSAGDDGTSYELVNGGAQFVLNANGTVTFNDGSIQQTAYTGNANGEYTLPTATTSTLGGVKIDGTSITIANGVISAGASDLSAYQTTAGLSANVAKLASNNSLFLGGIAANQYAYANQIAGSYTLPTANTTTLGGVKIDGSSITIANGVISSPNQDLSGYQTTTGLSANVATLTSNNSLYLGGVAANQYAYANQIVSVSATYVQNTDSRTLSGNLTFSGANLTITKDLTIVGTDFDKGLMITGNRGNIYLGNGTRDARTMISLNSLAGYFSGVQIDRANTELWFAGASNTESYVIRRSGTTDEIAVNSTTGMVTVGNLTVGNTIIGTTNNALYLGSVAANQYAYANSLSSYQTTAGLSANVATLSSNNSSYVGGVAANQYAYANGSNFGINNPITITYTGAGTGQGLNIITTNTQGGSTYADFIKVKNSTTGATANTKTFRLNNTGGLEIINDAYTATIFSLSDSGVVNTGEYQVNGKKAVNGPAFSAYPTSPAQTITTNSNTRVNFGNEEYDIGACYDAPNGKFQPNVEGYYQLNATVRIDGSSGTGERMIVIYKNGAEYKRGTNESGSEAASSFFTLTVSCMAYANGTSDYFQVYVVQSSGANRTISEFQQISYFQGCMVRGA